MPRSKEIQEQMRNKIVDMYQSGKGNKAISKALGLQRTTVRAIIHKWRKLGTVVNLPRSDRPTFTFTFMHLADAFIQSDLQCIQDIHFFISMCVPWELNPWPFALLTQCSTTEPQEHPTKITPRAQWRLIQEVIKERRTTSKELQASLASIKVSVHDSTIRKRLGKKPHPWESSKAKATADQKEHKG